MKHLLAGVLALLFHGRQLDAQQDSSARIGHQVITLSPLVIRNDINVPSFIGRITKDTSFYKAFRNLRVLNFTSINDIRMLNKHGNTRASLFSRTRQHAWKGCRITTIMEENTTGDFFDEAHHFNYYTADLYSSLFFAFDTLCGQDNLVRDPSITIRHSSGMSRHKEQLKMLFFNPGKEIPGIPFMGNKTAIFDEPVADKYDFSIDMDDRFGRNCYVFRVKARASLSAEERSDLVIDEMNTWFDHDRFQILARDYTLSYKAGIYDFDVHMEVELSGFGEWTVPTLIRYTGNWGLLFGRRERGVFTATLFDFSGE